jgi:hypothetical protein
MRARASRSPPHGSRSRSVRLPVLDERDAAARWKTGSRTGSRCDNVSWDSCRFALAPFDAWKERAVVAAATLTFNRILEENQPCGT